MVLDDDRVPSTIEPNIQNNRRIKLLNNSKFFILVQRCENFEKYFETIDDSKHYRC